MSRKLSALFLAMLVLAGAMSLKTVVAAHGNGAVIMANGPAPLPDPFRNGPAPLPDPFRNGPAPLPDPFRSGASALR
jgi:hypothetical protein